MHRLVCPVHRGVTREAQFPWRRITIGRWITPGGTEWLPAGAEKSQQGHKFFLQYSTFASERPQVRKWGRQTYFLPRVPFNLVTPTIDQITIYIFVQWKRNSISKMFYDAPSAKVYVSRNTSRRNYLSKAFALYSKTLRLRLVNATQMAAQRHCGHVASLITSPAVCCRIAQVFCRSHFGTCPAAHEQNIRASCYPGLRDVYPTRCTGWILTHCAVFCFANYDIGPSVFTAVTQSGIRNKRFTRGASIDLPTMHIHSMRTSSRDPWRNQAYTDAALLKLYVRRSYALVATIATIIWKGKTIIRCSDRSRCDVANGNQRSERRWNRRSGRRQRREEEKEKEEKRSQCVAEYWKRS